jgi:hypothetical protein
MLTDIIIYFVGGLISFFADVLPVFSIWPDSLIEGIEYIGNSFQSLNFFLPMYELSIAIVFVFSFFIFYYLERLIVMILNYIRGAGGIEI